MLQTYLYDVIGGKMRLSTLLKAICYLFYLIFISSVQAQPEMQIFFLRSVGDGEFQEEVPITENMVIDFNEVFLGSREFPYLGFVVKNLGNRELSLSPSPKLSSPFVLEEFPSSVEAGGKKYFRIECICYGKNLITVVNIPNNDPSKDHSFKFYIKTVGEITPKIQVFLEENGQELEIVDGSTVPIDFGTIPIYSEVTKYFTIRNDGKTKLGLTNLPPSLSHPFRLVKLVNDDFPSSIDANSEARFAIAVVTAEYNDPVVAAGDYNTVVDIFNSD
jgi:hypothetical protein